MGDEENQGNANNGLRRVKMKHPVFSGQRKENFQQFETKFRKWVELEGIEPNDEVQAMGICLSGDAEQCFDSLKRDDENITIELIIEALKLRYEEDRNDISIRNKIAKRVLREGESISQYYNEMRKWADHINMNDATLKFEFIKGLPQFMIEQIIAQGLETCTDTVRYAKTLEQARYIGKSRESEPKAELEKEVKFAKLAAASYPQNNNNRELMDLKENIKAMTKAIQDLVKDKKKEDENKNRREEENENGVDPQPRDQRRIDHIRNTQRDEDQSSLASHGLTLVVVASP